MGHESVLASRPLDGRHGADFTAEAAVRASFRKDSHGHGKLLRFQGAFRDLRGGMGERGSALDRTCRSRRLPCPPRNRDVGGDHGVTSALLSRVSPGKLSPGPAEAEESCEGTRLGPGRRKPSLELRAPLPEFERAIHKKCCNRHASRVVRRSVLPSAMASGVSRDPEGMNPHCFVRGVFPACESEPVRTSLASLLRESEMEEGEHRDV